MKPITWWRLARNGRLMALPALFALSRSFHRACFLSAAGSSGVLRLLLRGPASLDRLASELGVSAPDRGALEQWLHVGVGAGVLRRSGTRYALRGRLARALAWEPNDDMLAFVTETATLHQRLIVETPVRLRQGRRFTLEDQDGELIARSSRVAEPLVQEAIERLIPREGTVRLLEVGCGSGTYMRFAAERNPQLDALGLELQPNVAARAIESLRGWGLSGRCSVEVGDVRHRTPEPNFDVVTLHNNIYYFPTDGRTKVLAHLRGFLRPGGKVFVTTGCRGRSSDMAVLSLWGAVTRGCGPLPEPDELVTQIRDAGFRSVTARNLLAPFDRFYAFVGTV